QTALTHARRARESAERHGAPTYVILSDHLLAQACIVTGQFERAREQIHHGGETILAFGIEGLRPDQLVVRAEVELASGNAVDAYQLADECALLARRARLEPHLARVLLVLARAGARMGALGAGAEDALLDEARELLERMEMRSYLPFVRESRAEIAVLRGDA